MWFSDTPIGQMLDRVQRLDETKVFIKVSDNVVTKRAAELNREQLLRGINSEGTLLSDIGGPYSDFTLELHPEKSKFKVTLFDEGDYHESITVRVTANGYEFDHDPFKEDFGYTTDLTQEWGDEIIGLTDESIGKLVTELLIERYVNYLLEILKV